MVFSTVARASVPRSDVIEGALRHYQLCLSAWEGRSRRQRGDGRIDLKQLEYFVNVVELGGFSRAGRVLGIAQPAISRQVRSLEVELRQNLLLRNGRGATPTEAGKRLLEDARGILQQVDRARREVDETKDAPVGHVVVGLPPTVAQHLPVPWCASSGNASPPARWPSSKACRRRSTNGFWSVASTWVSSTIPCRRGGRYPTRCSKSSSVSSAPPARRAKRPRSGCATCRVIRC